MQEINIWKAVRRGFSRFLLLGLEADQMMIVWYLKTVRMTFSSGLFLNIVTCVSNNLNLINSYKKLYSNHQTLQAMSCNLNHSLLSKAFFLIILTDMYVMLISLVIIWYDWCSSSSLTKYLTFNNVSHKLVVSE